jgi:hypothetical protein
MGGSGRFSPELLSGLTLWMDGADQSTMTINGSDQITSWTDKSSNAIEFTATGSVAPIMTANAFGAKSAPDFGTRTKRLKATSAVLKALDEISVIVVTKATTSSTSQAGGSVQFTPEFLSVGNWATGAVDYGGQYIGSTIVTNAMKHVNVTQQAALGSNTTQMGWVAGAHSDAWVGMYEAGASGSAMLRGTFQMGNAVATSGVTNATDFSPAARSVTSNDIMLGSVINNTTQVGRGLGYIAEILVYNRYLTASEKSQLKSYLEGKWGIQSQVPAIHNITWGQSNKVVTDVLKSAAPSEFTSPTVGAYYYINGQYVHYCDTNVNQQSAAEYGTEQRFSRALYAATGKPVIVSKFAVVATDIASWSGPSGANYGTLSTRVAAAITNIQGFGFRFTDTVMTFQQGEQDGFNEANSLAYEANLGNALDYWMDDFGLGQIPIIADQIWVDASTVTYRANIRTATLAVAAARSNMRIINTDAGTTSDGIHWDADTVNDIALAEVQAYLTGTNQSL